MSHTASTMTQNGMSLTTKTQRDKSHRRNHRVSESVAPQTMFLRMKGASNADIIETANQYLHKHAYKISDIDGANNSSITQNVRLLREIVPLCPDPYVNKRTGELIREKWNETCNVKGSHLGSLVNATPSSSTWKRPCTNY